VLDVGDYALTLFDEAVFVEDFAAAVVVVLVVAGGEERFEENPWSLSLEDLRLLTQRRI
jgi:hypothetical protein